MGPSDITFRFLVFSWGVFVQLGCPQCVVEIDDLHSYMQSGYRPRAIVGGSVAKRHHRRQVYIYAVQAPYGQGGWVHPFCMLKRATTAFIKGKETPVPTFPAMKQTRARSSQHKPRTHVVTKTRCRQAGMGAQSL